MDSNWERPGKLVYISGLKQVEHTHSKSINHFRHNNIININLKILKSTFGKVGGGGTLKIS